MPEEPSMTKLMGTILRLIARSCSSRRVSVKRMGRSLSRHSCLISCVCSTNMSMTCTHATTASSLTAEIISRDIHMSTGTCAPHRMVEHSRLHM